MPNPLAGEHQTGLFRAAEKLRDELMAATPTSWDITTYNNQTPPSSPPPGTGIFVRISPAAGIPAAGYRINDNGYLVIRAPTMAGAIDGVHGVRIRLRMDEYTGSSMSGGMTNVDPAFLRRGFMILNPEPDWTEDDWTDYVDYHQLLGANLLTVGIPGVYDPSDARTYHLKSWYDNLVATMHHCHDVGMKFQITTFATIMSPGFYWDHFEPEHLHYLPDGTVTAGSQADDIGPEKSDGFHEHPLIHFPPAASMAKVAADAGLAADLKAHQANLYETFAEADAFLVAFTEGAADYGSVAVSNPESNIVEAHLAWVRARVDKGHDDYALAGGLDVEPANLVYYGWLHFKWWAWALAVDENEDGKLDETDLDPPFDGHGDDLDGHEAHLGFGDWSESTPSIIDSYIDPDPGNTLVRSEWIQETGLFYFDMGVVHGTVEGLHSNDSLPESMVDPLGYVADVEVAGSKVFDTTAFLYWCHEEADFRNYFLRPAIKETIFDLRAALRKTVEGAPPWNPHPAATGVMGYRFAAPTRRFLNDFVTLRCASDKSLLDFNTADLSETGLNALRDLAAADMARFLVQGDPGIVPALKDSIIHLDAALPLFDPKSPAEVVASLDELNTPSAVPWWDALSTDELPWWDRRPRLADYYQLLAFTCFLEQAKQQSPNNDDLVAAAVRVARQTRHLFNFVHEEQVRQIVD